MNLLILLIGCSFGFFILQKDSPHDHFENPFKSIVKVGKFITRIKSCFDLLEIDIFRYATVQLRIDTTV